MAFDLASTPVTGIQVQACGDAHVCNFGEFATPERNVVFDINDFDETIPGPWEWDVKRLCASLHIVGRQQGLKPSAITKIVLSAVSEYREQMNRYAQMPLLDLWYDRIHIRDVLDHFPKRYRGRVWRHVRRAYRKTHQRAAEKFMGGGEERRFLEAPPLLVRLENTGFDMAEVHSPIDNYRLSLSSERRFLFDQYELLDVARKVVGVGSVGTHCWIALFEDLNDPDGTPLILQVKEAQASVLEPFVGASFLDHNGERVVEGQRVTQAASDIFLGWTQGPRSGRQYYVRQLWDVKGQGDPLTMDPIGLSYYGALCAWALARAHARTGDASQIAGYLGKSAVFDRAIADFSQRYAEVNERDHAQLSRAVARGKLELPSEDRPAGALLS